MSKFRHIYKYIFFIVVVMAVSLVAGFAAWTIYVQDSYTSDGYEYEDNVCLLHNNNGDTYYTSLGRALKDAEANGIADYIFLLPNKDGTADREIVLESSSSSYTLSSADTLVLSVAMTYTSQYDETWKDNYKSYYTGTKLFETIASLGLSNFNRMIKLKLDASLTINGEMYIGSVYNQQGQLYQGFITGNYCELDLNGKTVTLSGGSITSYGNITDTSTNESGVINVRNASNLSTNFCIDDYHGGWDAAGKYFNNQSPFNMYRLPYLDATTRIYYGGSLKAHCVLYASSVQNEVIQTIFGPAGLVEILSTESTSSSYIEHKPSSYAFDKEEPNNNQHLYKEIININLDVKLNSLQLLSMVDTQTVFFPINKYFQINVKSAKVELTEQIKILPGTDISFQTYSELVLKNNVTMFDTMYDATPSSTGAASLYTFYYTYFNSDGSSYQYYDLDEGQVKFDSTSTISTDSTINCKVSGLFVFTNESNFNLNKNTLTRATNIDGVVETVEGAAPGNSAYIYTTLKSYNVDLELHLLSNNVVVKKYRKDSYFSYDYSYTSDGSTITQIDVSNTSGGIIGSIIDPSSGTTTWDIYTDATTSQDTGQTYSSIHDDWISSMSSVTATDGKLYGFASDYYKQFNHNTANDTYWIDSISDKYVYIKIDATTYVRGHFDETYSPLFIGDDGNYYYHPSDEDNFNNKPTEEDWYINVDGFEGNKILIAYSEYLDGTDDATYGYVGYKDSDVYYFDPSSSTYKHITYYPIGLEYDLQTWNETEFYYYPQSYVEQHIAVQYDDYTATEEWGEYYYTWNYSYYLYNENNELVTGTLGVTNDNIIGTSETTTEVTNFSPSQPQTWFEEANGNYYIYNENSAYFNSTLYETETQIYTFDSDGDGTDEKYAYLAVNDGSYNTSLAPLSELEANVYYKDGTNYSYKYAKTTEFTLNEDGTYGYYDYNLFYSTQGDFGSGWFKEMDASKSSSHFIYSDTIASYYAHSNNTGATPTNVWWDESQASLDGTVFLFLYSDGTNTVLYNRVAPSASIGYSGEDFVATGFYKASYGRTPYLYLIINASSSSTPTSYSSSSAHLPILSEYSYQSSSSIECSSGTKNLNIYTTILNYSSSSSKETLGMNDLIVENFSTDNGDTAVTGAWKYNTTKNIFYGDNGTLFLHANYQYSSIYCLNTSSAYTGSSSTSGINGSEITGNGTSGLLNFKKYWYQLSSYQTQSSSTYDLADDLLTFSGISKNGSKINYIGFDGYTIVSYRSGSFGDLTTYRFTSLTFDGVKNGRPTGDLDANSDFFYDSSTYTYIISNVAIPTNGYTLTTVENRLIKIKNKNNNFYYISDVNYDANTYVTQAKMGLYPTYVKYTNPDDANDTVEYRETYDNILLFRPYYRPIDGTQTSASQNTYHNATSSFYYTPALDENGNYLGYWEYNSAYTYLTA